MDPIKCRSVHSSYIISIELNKLLYIHIKVTALCVLISVLSLHHTEEFSNWVSIQHGFKNVVSRGLLNISICLRCLRLKDKFTQKCKTQSLSTHLNFVWTARESFQSTKHFWSFTAKQHSRKQLEQVEIKYNVTTTLTPVTHGTACAPTQDKVCTNTFNLIATWKILSEKDANHLLLDKMLDLWPFRDLVYMGEVY